MKTDVLVVLTTAGSDEQAGRIASVLVEEGLAACVNIVSGVASVYRWKGEVTRDDERLLLVKTTEPLFEAVRVRIRALHSYELPEIIALRVAAGDDAALDWIRDSVTGPQG